MVGHVELRCKSSKPCLKKNTINTAQTNPQQNNQTWRGHWIFYIVRYFILQTLSTNNSTAYLTTKCYLWMNDKRERTKKSIKKRKNREYGLNQIVTDVQKAIYVRVSLSSVERWMTPINNIGKLSYFAPIRFGGAKYDEWYKIPIISHLHNTPVQQTVSTTNASVLIFISKILVCYRLRNSFI